MANFYCRGARAAVILFGIRCAGLLCLFVFADMTSYQSFQGQLSLHDTQSYTRTNIHIHTHTRRLAAVGQQNTQGGRHKLCDTSSGKQMYCVFLFGLLCSMLLCLCLCCVSLVCVCVLGDLVDKDMALRKVPAQQAKARRSLCCVCVVCCLLPLFLFFFRFLFLLF